MREEIVLSEDVKIGKGNPPLIIPEIGINHGGSIGKAKKMILDAHNCGAKCVKFQCHIPEEEMLQNEIIPANAKSTIWEIIRQCTLSEAEEYELKKYTESLGMIYISTPFSIAAADRLEEMGVVAYKIGSGECNNYPLIKHVASFKKPIFLSTGMNEIKSIANSVAILENANIPYALLHCTSIYPAPFEKMNLGFMDVMKQKFPNAIIGLSDHSIGNFISFAAVAKGASVIERHFASSPTWEGPDISLSLLPYQFNELVFGSNAIYMALKINKKVTLAEEERTALFANASVVTTKKIEPNEMFSFENISVKRPGTGEFKAAEYETILGKHAAKEIPANCQLTSSMIMEK